MGDRDATSDDEDVEMEVKDTDDDDTPYGTTVRVAQGHIAGGTVGGIYEWIGSDGTDVYLSRENFASTSRWRLISPDSRLLASEDYSKTDLWELAD